MLIRAGSRLVLLWPIYTIWEVSCSIEWTIPSVIFLGKVFMTWHVGTALLVLVLLLHKRRGQLLFHWSLAACNFRISASCFGCSKITILFAIDGTQYITQIQQSSYYIGHVFTGSSFLRQIYRELNVYSNMQSHPPSAPDTCLWLEKSALSVTHPKWEQPERGIGSQGPRQYLLAFQEFMSLSRLHTIGTQLIANTYKIFI